MPDRIKKNNCFFKTVFFLIGLSFTDMLGPQFGIIFTFATIENYGAGGIGVFAVQVLVAGLNSSL